MSTSIDWTSISCWHIFIGGSIIGDSIACTSIGLGSPIGAGSSIDDTSSGVGSSIGGGCSIGNTSIVNDSVENNSDGSTFITDVSRISNGGYSATSPLATSNGAN